MFFVGAGAAGPFFFGDAEVDAGAFGDFVPVAGEGSQVVARAILGSQVRVYSFQFRVGGGGAEFLLDDFFGEVEAIGGALFGAVGAVLFAEIEGDFVFVHFLSAFFFGGAEGGAFGEVSEALEGEELGGAGGGAGEFDGGVEDGLVRGGEFFFVAGGGEEEMDVALAQGFEGGEGEFFVGRKLRVDDVEERDFGVEGLERAFGDVESETFGAWLVDAHEDVIVIAVAEPIGELFAFAQSEAGEGGLDLWFSHRFWSLEIIIAKG